MDGERLADIAKALGHPARAQIVAFLAKQPDCRGADVFGALPLAQSTVSEHLRMLREAGIVHVTPVGTANVYCLERDVLAEFSAAVFSLAQTAPVCSTKGAC